MTPARSLTRGFLADAIVAPTYSDKHGLMQRDIKPCNIHVMPEGQARLLDFSLARHSAKHLTELRILLGTIDFMAPNRL